MCREYNSKNSIEEKIHFQGICIFQEWWFWPFSSTLLSILMAHLKFYFDKIFTLLWDLVQICSISNMTLLFWSKLLTFTLLASKRQITCYLLCVLIPHCHLLSFLIYFLTILQSSTLLSKHRIMQYLKIYKLSFLAVLAGTFYETVLLVSFVVPLHYRFLEERDHLIRL